MNATFRWPALLAGLVVAVIAALGLRPFIETERRSDQREALGAYTAERAAGRNALFAQAGDIQAAASALFLRHYGDLSDAELQRIFEDRFPVYDGATRRSRAADFEGRRTPSGHLVYGLGAFLSGVDFTLAEQRAAVAAYLTVSHIGPGASGLFDNIYFNDARNRLIMFAPERDDRLEFYRRTAPPDFDFSDHPFVEIALPQANPSGALACTALTDLVYRQDERRMTIGCHLPVRHAGRHLGAFGMTLDVKAYLAETVADPSGRDAMVISRNGEIVAHPALFGGDVITEADVIRVRDALQLDRLSAAITANGRAQAVIEDPTRPGLAAFVKLEAPGWYLVIREASVASGAASWLQALLFGLAAGILVVLQLCLLPRKRARTRMPISEAGGGAPGRAQASGRSPASARPAGV